MGRQHRVVIEGFVHVTMRVISGELLFRDGRDASRLLLIAGDVFERDPIEVEAYCLMPNHYHLLVRDRTGQASATMRDLNGRYARAFNRRHGRRGPLFDRRFHATPVEGDAHAIDCLRYIALNPVEARPAGRLALVEPSGAVRRRTPAFLADRTAARCR